METKVGSSCAFDVSMALGKVVEARAFINSNSNWRGVIRYAVDHKQYLIVNLNLNITDDIIGVTDEKWANLINEVCNFMVLNGCTRYNSRTSLINEPLKRLTKEQYAHYIGIAYPIIHSYGFEVGAGNEEFFTAQALGFMYQYILEERRKGHINFDILDCHWQGSCSTPGLTREWTDEAISWSNYWNIPLDCTEAFYGDIRTPYGFNLLKVQLQEASRAGCPNFCSVFNNMDRAALSDYDTTKWDKLAFMINGTLQNNTVAGYWNEWVTIINTNGPVERGRFLFRPSLEH